MAIYWRYQLKYYDKSEDKGTYSFCMCPGGHVLSSGTKEDGIVTNGMSNSKRGSPWSNAAIVVTVDPKKDLKDETLFAGRDFQRKIEKNAYKLSKKFASGREIPMVKLKDFIIGKVTKTSSLGHSSPSKGVFVDF